MSVVTACNFKRRLPTCPGGTLTTLRIAEEKLPLYAAFCSRLSEYKLLRVKLRTFFSVIYSTVNTILQRSDQASVQMAS